MVEYQDYGPYIGHPTTEPIVMFSCCVLRDMVRSIREMKQLALTDADVEEDALTSAKYVSCTLRKS